MFVPTCPSTGYAMSSHFLQGPRLDVAKFNRRGQRIRVDARGLVKLGWFKKQEVEVPDVPPGGAPSRPPERRSFKPISAGPQN